MWTDKSGWAHVEDQYDPATWADHPDNRGDVDWTATDMVAEREFKRPPRAMRKFDGLRGEVK